MSSKMCIATILVSLFVFTRCSRQLDIYISPNGSDSNKGTRKEPLASLMAAREHAAALVKNNPGKDITVWLDEGIYHVADPMVFRYEDSGEAGASIHFRAVEDGKVVISGGKHIRDWQRKAESVWAAPVMELTGAELSIRELFIDGKRARRSRHPNNGYLLVKQAGEDRRTNFYFTEGDFPIPENIRDVELTLLHDWSVSRIHLDTIISTQNWLSTGDSIGARQPSFFNIDNWEKQPRYFLENAPEFMDEDYEWYLDHQEQMVFLKLPEMQHPDSMNIVVPVSEGLLQFSGTEERPISNLMFHGLVFSYSQWELPVKAYGGIQACHYGPGPAGKVWGVVPAAVNGRWMKDIVFENCTFEHLGGSGLWIGTGSANCSVINCTFSDISGNGIMIGEGRDRTVNGKPWWQEATDQVADGNLIENCTVTQCGMQFFGAVGIWCGLTANTTIRNNEVHSLPYTGISIGWMWSPEPTPCRQNVIDGNHIHHIMEILSDGGGIYMLGLQPGSRLTGNHIHDVRVNAGRAESNGMFLDEGTTDVVVEKNLIYHIAMSPLRFHRATTNLVKDNVLACGAHLPPIRYNRTEEEDIQKVDNVILQESSPEDQAKLEEIIKGWIDDRQNSIEGVSPQK